MSESKFEIYLNISAIFKREKHAEENKNIKVYLFFNLKPQLILTERILLNSTELKDFSAFFSQQEMFKSFQFIKT